MSTSDIDVSAPAIVALVERLRKVGASGQYIGPETIRAWIAPQDARDAADALTALAAERDASTEAFKQSVAIVASLSARLEVREEKIASLSPVIEHGDDKHRQWLRDKLREHFEESTNE